MMKRPGMPKDLSLSIRLGVVLCALLAGLFVRPAAAEVFLQGKYVEVGIHDSGSFGTLGPAPEGYHPKNRSALGFVADQGKDGWTVGTPPQTGDYFLPGDPEEGWMVQWVAEDGTAVLMPNFGLMGDFAVPQTSLTKTSSGATEAAVWEGTATNGSDQGLHVTQTVTLNADDLFFVINVVLTNTGTTTLHSLKYMRNVDPDQEVDLSGSFSTQNWVSFQPPRPASGDKVALDARPADNVDKALVVAKGQLYGLTLGLGTIDSRAVVAAQGFSNRDADWILNDPIQPLESDSSIQDEAIALAYDLGDLAPGQSVVIDYAYVLNEGDLEVALGALAAVTILQPTGSISGDSVLFQVTTNDVAKTEKIDFYVAGKLVGSATTPDAGGVFQIMFDSTRLPDGPVTLKAVATFTGGTVVEKTTTVTVDNSGPPMHFVTPVNDQYFSGSAIPITIGVDDAKHPPVRVSFFRETPTTGSLFLGEDTEAPFESSFDVTGLPKAEVVVIKAVGYDSAGRSTTISVAGTADTVISFLLKGDVNHDGTIDEIDYHLIAVSGLLAPSEPNALKVFGGTPPPASYNPNEIRLFSYDNHQDNDTATGDYAEYPAIPDVAAGNGYWAITRTDREISVSGEPLPTGTPVTVTLYPGWNIVGYPFLEPLPWVYLEVQLPSDEYSYPIWAFDGIDSVAWGYDQGYFEVTGTPYTASPKLTSGTENLEPWHAYWFRYNGSEPVNLIIPSPYLAMGSAAKAGFAVSRLTAQSTECKGLAFSFKASGKPYTDRTVFLGFAPGALDGPDRLDVMAPPEISNSVPRIYVQHSDWEKRSGLYAVDIRPDTAAATFDVTLKVPKRKAKATYVLSWTGSDGIPSERKITLVDKARHRSINMRRKSSYQFAVPAKKTVYQLKVMVK